MIENGHRDIAYLKGNEESSSTSALCRIRGRNGKSTMSISARNGFYPAITAPKAAIEACRLFETRSKTYRSNFRIGCGSVWRHESSARSRNRYSGDLSLVGFDDGMLAAYSYPPLTSIRRPIGEMAAEGARQLLRLIEGESWPENTVCYPVRLSIKKIDPSTERNRTEITIVPASKSTPLRRTKECAFKGRTWPSSFF